MYGSSPPAQAFVEDLRRHRAQLRESMSALELALAAPATVDRVRWAERVHVAVVELSADLRAHIDLTEGVDGVYAELLEAAPRVAGPIARLTREHVEFRGLVDELLDCLSPPGNFDDVDGARDRGTALLGRLIRHRQRGSDVFYEAYKIDIGGET